MAKTSVDFNVDIESPIAVYMQIENQVQFAVVSGQLAPGDTLPSVRELSSMLAINPNTVTKAYRDLELLGLVHTRRGVGVTVAEGAADTCRDRVFTMVHHHLNDAVGEAVACGWPSEKVRVTVGSALERRVRPYAHTNGRA